MKTSHLPQFSLRVLAVLTLALGCSNLFAATINESGALPAGNPNALVEILFTTPTNVTGFNVFTDSFTSFANPSSGFDPVLWLFNPAMTTQIDKDDDICNAGGCNNLDPAANRNAQI